MSPICDGVTSSQRSFAKVSPSIDARDLLQTLLESRHGIVALEGGGVAILHATVLTAEQASAYAVDRLRMKGGSAA